METEELQGDNIQNQSRPPAPVPPILSGGLPPYPEMIVAAIEALNEEQGSNKSSISKQIEATYGNLPPAHSTLLTHHLKKMKSSGQLIFAKNNYLKPDPNAPPRRGRGRPPKPKSPLPAGAVASPPRARGRPAKPLDPTAPAPATNVSGKKRGRPAKTVAAGVAEAPPAGVDGLPRGRGRPPKVKQAMAAAPVGA